MRAIGKFIWRFMVIFSFIVNFVLIAVLIVAGLFIFQIKNQVADPLITGLHATSVGLNDATIDWVIPVRDTIPVELDIPLNQSTVVVLDEPVPLNVNAIIDLPGLNANDVPAFVSLTLPRGLELPVTLDLMVPVDEPLDIALDVRAVIPLSQTQLHDPIDTLGLLFEPLSIGLHNLPDNYGEVPDFLSQLLESDDAQNLLLATDGTGFNAQSYDPWPGYSRTAGLNYQLFTAPYPEDSEAMTTGIVNPGGIPVLDQLIRPQVQYDGADLRQPLSAQSLTVPEYTYDGSMADYYNNIQAQIEAGNTGVFDTQALSDPSNTEPEDFSVIPTPSAP